MPMRTIKDENDDEMNSLDRYKVVLVSFLLFPPLEDAVADADEHYHDGHHDSADDAPCGAEGARRVLLVTFRRNIEFDI